jgi:hypothetical protein
MSTPQIISIPLSATTTTLHRNWANAVSAALTAAGLPKTADTGQINLTGTTIVYPTVAQGLLQGAAAFTGYEIRTLTSAGKPTIYLKIRYGIFYNGAGVGANFYWPALSISVGTATDGAGNLTLPDGGGTTYTVGTGGTMTGSLTAGSGRPSAVAQQCIINSDGANYLTVAMGNQAPSFETKWIACFGIERTNTPGAATFAFNGNGLVMWNGLSQASDNTQNVAGAAYVASSTVARQCLYDLALSQVFVGGTISGQTPSYIYRPNVATDASIYPVTVGVGHGPLTTIAPYDSGQIIENTQFTAPLYGLALSYIAAGARADAAGDAFGITNLAMRIN